MKTKSLLILLLSAMFFTAACSSSDEKDDAVVIEQAALSVTQTVALYSYSFSPATLNINAGDTVVFENNDPDVRNVSIAALNIDQNIEPTSSWRYTFVASGEYQVTDRLASGDAKMTIVVQ